MPTFSVNLASRKTPDTRIPMQRSRRQMRQPVNAPRQRSACRYRRVGSPLRVLLSSEITSVVYILHLTLCAKAMHNISAYIEPCMTSKKSFGNPQIPLSPGPVFRCFQKIAKTRGFDPIFQEIGRLPLPPESTFPCRRPQFFGGVF